jgi:hypothetical protein
LQGYAPWSRSPCRFFNLISEILYFATRSEFIESIPVIETPLFLSRPRAILNRFTSALSRGKARSHEGESPWSSRRRGCQKADEKMISPCGRTAPRIYR